MENKMLKDKLDVIKKKNTAVNNVVDDANLRKRLRNRYGIK